MSQEAVELFRRLMETVNVPEPEAVIAPLVAPNFRIENTATAVTDKTYHGVAGCLEWRNDLPEGFAEGVRFEVEAIITDGDDFVVGRVALVGTGARSGAPLHLRWVTVAWFQDGKATRIVGYANRHQALEAVGLRE